MKKPPFEEDEEFFIRRHSDKTAKWIAKKLGRTESSISKKRNYLGMKKFKSPGIPKHVYLPIELIDIISKTANEQGYTFSGYVRMVLEREIDRPR